MINLGNRWARYHKLLWSANLAYVVGLITTDGNLSKDGRHIALVSKDKEQLDNFIRILSLKTQIYPHTSTFNPSGKYFRVEFSNVRLYKFLINIGLIPNKSLVLGSLNIPAGYFNDFLRGHLDGDGNISIVKHNESQHLQLRLRFSSGSIKHLEWLKNSISELYGIQGGFISTHIKTAGYLVYSKADAKILLELIYYVGVKYFLHRKYNYYLEKMGE